MIEMIEGMQFSDDSQSTEGFSMTRSIHEETKQQRINKVEPNRRQMAEPNHVNMNWLRNFNHIMHNETGGRIDEKKIKQINGPMHTSLMHHHKVKNEGYM
jgi:hypothetical protein